MMARDGKVSKNGRRIGMASGPAVGISKEPRTDGNGFVRRTRAPERNKRGPRPYPVPTKYQNLQVAKERRMAKRFSLAVAFLIVVASVSWFLWR